MSSSTVEAAAGATATATTAAAAAGDASQARGDAASASSSLFLEFDDAETLALLYDSNNVDSDRWSALVSRIRKDYFLISTQASATAPQSPTTQPFAPLLPLLRQRGFVHASYTRPNNAGSILARHPDDSSDNALTATALPVALGSVEEIQRHLDAVCALLNVSPTLAIKLTMSSMLQTTVHDGDSDNDISKNAPLLGSVNAVTQVVNFYYTQRLARLTALAELLRREEDHHDGSGSSTSAGGTGSAAAGSTATTILNSLDALVVNERGESRGLLCVLVAAAVEQPEPGVSLLQRHAFVPLRHSTGNGSNTSSNGSALMTETSWPDFIHQCLHLSRSYIWQEREAAMEALLVLLFRRTKVGRNDLAVLLSLFFLQQPNSLQVDQSSNGTGTDTSTATATASSSRFWQLCGLVCVECMSLWRVLSNADDDDENVENQPNNKPASFRPGTAAHTNTPYDWKTRHPLLEGSDNGNDPQQRQIQVELQSIAAMLQQALNTQLEKLQVTNGNSQDGREAPVHLAMLSFGVLLKATAANSGAASATIATLWTTLASVGSDLTTTANHNDAFDFLKGVMTSLVLPPRRVHKRTPQFPFDFEAFYPESAASLLAEEQSAWASQRQEVDAAQVAYASIGRELYTTSIYVFQDILLPTHKVPTRSNVHSLTSLFTVVIGLSPTLAQNFWSEWVDFASNASKRKYDRAPLCRLLDAAQRLAVTALQKRHREFNVHDVLQAFAFLFELVAAFSYDASVVEEALATIFPPGLIQAALLLLESQQSSIMSSESANLVAFGETILQSLSTLTNVGSTSSSCRFLLRAALEESDGAESAAICGPQMLARIAKKFKSTIARHAILAMADLVDGATVEWQLEAVRALRSFQSDESFWIGLFSGQDAATKAIVQLIRGIVGGLGKMVFSAKLGESITLDILSVVQGGVLACCEFLVMSAGRGDSSFVSTGLAIECISYSLQQQHPITRLHASSQVRSAALQCISKTVSVLAGHHRMGEVLCQFVAAPVSISILSSIGNAGRAEVARSSLFSQDETDNIDHSKALLRTKILGVHSCPIDFRAPHMLTWMRGDDDSTAPLQTAVNALRLLNWWTLSLELTGVAEALYPLSVSGPGHHLVDASPPPPHLQMGTTLGFVWSGTPVPLWALLPPYLCKNNSVVESELALEAFDFIVSSLVRIVDIVDRSAVVRDILETPSWRSELMYYAARVDYLVAQNQHTPTEELEICCGLRCLDLFLLFMKTSPTSVFTVLNKDDGALFGALVNVVNAVSSAVRSQASSHIWTAQLRIATGCLALLHEVWTSYRSGELDDDHDVLKRKVDGTTTSLLPGITSCVLGDSLQKLFPDRISKESKRGHGSALAFASAAVDLLSIELSWMERSSTDRALVGAIEGLLGGKLDGIVEACSLYLVVPSLASIARSFTAVKEALNHVSSVQWSTSDVELMVQVQAGPATNGSVVHSNASHEQSTMPGRSWQRFLRDVELDNSSWDEMSSELKVSCYMTYQETRCLQSWAWMIQFLVPVITSLRNTSPQPSVAAAVARLFHNNVDLVYRTRPARINQFFARECNQMTAATAGLLLTLLNTEAASASMEESLVSMGLLCEIAAKLWYIGVDGGLGTFTAIRNVLASIGVLEGRVTKEAVDVKARLSLKGFLKEVASTCCNVLSALQKSPIEPNASFEVFSVCATLLSCAVGKVVDTSTGRREVDDLLSAQLLQIFETFEVMRSLLLLTDKYSQTAHGDAFFLATRSFFTEMAATDSADFLALLVSNQSVFLSSNRYQLGDCLPQRLPTPPCDEKWLARLGLLSACLRSSRRRMTTNDEVAERLATIATNFVLDNKDAMLQCLARGSSVEYGPSHADHRGFSLTSLREAKLVLEIISELCTKDVFMFKHRHWDLVRELTGRAASLLVSLSSFLAASAASRWIFTAFIKEDELEAMADDDPPFASLGPASRYFADGLQNAKHEAIRFASHFDLNCSAAMSESERQALDVFSNRWLLTPTGQSQSESFSMAALERKCRSSVTNKYAFMLELEAAEAAFAAVKTLWATHPASSSFVLFTESELARFDVMNFVRVGTVIAFRSRGNGPSVPDPLTGCPERLEVGTVVQSNTVGRQWRVRIASHANRPNDERTVNASQLAGIEDEERRVAMLAYKEAPDSASGLESSEAPLSAGHLILVLRWCSQFFTEERNSLFPYDTTSAIVRLAELTSAFLGLELTVREQSGVQHQPQSRQLLAEQVLDLFGEATEFNGAATTMREGQLKPLLSSSMWQGTRSQLQSYLEAAVTFAALPQSTGGGSFSFHASEGNSPFQDVNMYQ